MSYVVHGRQWKVLWGSSRGSHVRYHETRQEAYRHRRVLELAGADCPRVLQVMLDGQKTN